MIEIILEMAEQAIDNPRNSQAADVKAVEALWETLKSVACTPAVNMA